MQILYKDRELIVCIKPSGILSEGEGADTLPSALSALLTAEGEKNTEIFPVHRLDRETEGVMLFARTKNSAAALSESIREGSLCKIYLACIQGVPEKREDTLCDLLYFDRRLCKAFTVTRERKGVKSASLEYRVLAVQDGISLLKIRLHTGRTHQIRAQLASRQLPLVGDRRYGATRSECDSVALLAYSLSFPHPKDKRILTFMSDIPQRLPWTKFEQIDETPLTSIQ